MNDKLRAFTLCVASAVVAAAAMAADSVPAVTPLEFAESSPTAGFVWSLLAQPEVVSLVLAAIGGVFGLIQRNRHVKKWRLERAAEFLEAGTRETYEEYVREAQKANADGKLTVAERNEAMQKAIDKAKAYCRQNGFELFKVYAKEYVPVLIERIIGVQKAYGRAAVPFPPLADLEP